MVNPVRKQLLAVCMAALSAFCLPALADDDGHTHPGGSRLVWLDRLSLVSGKEAELTTAHDSTKSGVGGGLAGLVIESATIGNTFSDGGNKVVQTAAQVPPGQKVSGVRVCYELTAGGAAGSYITQIRLAQVQDPPATALVLLDDATALIQPGPICVDSAVVNPPIGPTLGALLLDLRVNFQNTSDRIVVRGLALHLTH